MVTFNDEVIFLCKKKEVILLILVFSYFQIIFTLRLESLRKIEGNIRKGFTLVAYTLVVARSQPCSCARWT